MADALSPAVLSALCHELRGALGAVGNWVHVLGVPNLEASRGECALRSLNDDIRAMGGAIDQLSNLASALSAPNETLPILAGPFLQTLAEERQATGHQTAVRVSDPLLRLLGDPARLRDMLWPFLAAPLAPDEVAVTAEPDVVVVTLRLGDPRPRPLSLVIAGVLARHQDGDLVATVGEDGTILRFRLRRAP